VFVRRLHAMDGQAKEKLAQALKVSPQPTLIRSAFDLPPGQRAAVQNALNEISQADIQVRFETAAELICGIELIANGEKIAWSVADYLTSLENSLGDVFNTKIESAPIPLTAAI
jgi:F-type H+-transporting ATPase subunit b